MSSTDTRETGTVDAITRAAHRATDRAARAAQHARHAAEPVLAAAADQARHAVDLATHAVGNASHAVARAGDTVGGSVGEAAHAARRTHLPHLPHSLHAGGSRPDGHTAKRITALALAGLAGAAVLVWWRRGRGADHLSWLSPDRPRARWF
ncbi:hypothetical protein C7C46_28365 [Streptomyces tateyamensis]|uniref:Uncharacterized protein n=1 Tax=Streptomyces tateyamensis TaxID=565073 RepID=A0A2V4NII2_9ACTN|nr:hypothetical protein [Streptomyces tateyamensis]PYC69033.1 hypothetical protein C7C46_28365 [Streptomyces tateyamensis]